MTDDQYDKLLKTVLVLADDIRAVRSEMATKIQVEAVYDLLDKNNAEHQRQEIERAAMNGQLDRLDHWVHELADKTGTTLTYKQS